MIWNDKIFDEIDVEELEMLCNPINHYKTEEVDTFYFIFIIY